MSRLLHHTKQVGSPEFISFAPRVGATCMKKKRSKLDHNLTLWATINAPVELLLGMKHNESRGSLRAIAMKRVELFRGIISKKNYWCLTANSQFLENRYHFRGPEPRAPRKPRPIQRSESLSIKINWSWAVSCNDGTPLLSGPDYDPSLFFDERRAELPTCTRTSFLNLKKYVVFNFQYIISSNMDVRSDETGVTFKILSTNIHQLRKFRSKGRDASCSWKWELALRSGRRAKVRIGTEPRPNDFMLLARPKNSDTKKASARAGQRFRADDLLVKVHQKIESQ